jgi:transcriptional regulator with XRE-family HTH domain
VSSRHRPHPSNEWVELGVRIKSARLKAGMTQVEASAIFGRDQSVVARIERGERQLSALELRDLCRAFGVPYDAVLDG